jgi:hypothetical protein
MIRGDEAEIDKCLDCLQVEAVTIIQKETTRWFEFSNHDGTQQPHQTSGLSSGWARLIGGTTARQSRCQVLSVAEAPAGELYPKIHGRLFFGVSFEADH